MKRTTTIEAADKSVGITFDQLSEMVNEVGLSRTMDSTFKVTGRIAGLKGRLVKLEIEYEVFPTDEARRRGTP